MRIESVTDESFAPYGKILDGYDTSGLVQVLKQLPLGEGVTYVPSHAELEAQNLCAALKNNAFGGMPIEIGACYGHNTRLNCLEYHRDSEINIGARDFILLVALESEIKDGVLDTSMVKAFRAPAGTVVELYATTLHYAPCHTNATDGFRVAIVLPKGTNTPKPEITTLNDEDRLLWACNKWLIAHPDSSEAAMGAYVGLKGENIDIAGLL